MRALLTMNWGSRVFGIALIASLAAAVGCAGGGEHALPAANTWAIGTFSLRTDSSADSVIVARVAPAFFPDSGVGALLGRFFVAGDYAPSASLNAVISHDLWVNRFHASRAVMGTRILLNGRGVTLVGVAPSGFPLPQGVELLVPGMPK